MMRRLRSTRDSSRTAAFGVGDEPPLTDLVNRRSWAARRTAVSRGLLPLGYRHRRPRHDLTHRQDPETGAAAKHVLVEL